MSGPLKNFVGLVTEMADAGATMAVKYTIEKFGGSSTTHINGPTRTLAGTALGAALGASLAISASTESVILVAERLVSSVGAITNIPIMAATFGIAVGMTVAASAIFNSDPNKEIDEIIGLTKEQYKADQDPEIKHRP